MPQPIRERIVFGPSKYAAFHLLLSRWLRHYAKKSKYCYVTLGGTELKDIQSVYFIDPELTCNAVSFERIQQRHALAEVTAARLAPSGISITTVRQDIFTFQRQSETPHFFFVDIEGAFASADYYLRFAQMLRDEVLREDDVLFVTSYLGRNPGWERVFQRYDGEFRALGIEDSDSKRKWYRLAHPSFTLFQALAEADLQQQLNFECVGCVEYRDTSSMGLYAYTISPGRTIFTSFVRSTRHFHISKGYFPPDQSAWSKLG